MVLWRGKGLDDEGGKYNAQDGDDRKNQGQGPEKLIGETPEFLGRLIAHVPREDRDEGGGNGTLTDQAAYQIRNAIGENEGVGGEGGTEKEGDTLVANVAEDTADDSDQGYNRGGFEDLLFLSVKDGPSGT